MESTETGRTNRPQERLADPTTRTPTATRAAPPSGATAVAIAADATDHRRPRVSWGPLWAGFVITLAMYLILQLALIAVGLVDLPVEGGSDGWWSAAAALVAFFLGGLVAGATAAWRGVGDGMLHGLIMWGLAIAAMLALAALGSGLALGSLDTTSVFDDLTSNLETANPDDAQDAAGWSLLGVCVAAAAAVIGGAVGGALWHRDRHRAETAQEY
jgi:hypothetical protein